MKFSNFHFELFVKFIIFCVFVSDLIMYTLSVFNIILFRQKTG
jgi:hypothetical protein